MTPLRQRIERVERAVLAIRAPVTGDAAESRERFAAEIAALADRVRGTPAPPAQRQSAAERIVRAALDDAEGTDGHEYLRCFWQGVTARIRAERRHELWGGVD